MVKFHRLIFAHVVLLELYTFVVRKLSDYFFVLLGVITPHGEKQ